jgi:hypothetical protein
MWDMKRIEHLGSIAANHGYEIRPAGRDHDKPCDRCKWTVPKKDDLFVQNIDMRRALTSYRREQATDEDGHCDIPVKYCLGCFDAECEKRKMIPPFVPNDSFSSDGLAPAEEASDNDSDGDGETQPARPAPMQRDYIDYAEGLYCDYDRRTNAVGGIVKEEPISDEEHWRGEFEGEFNGFLNDDPESEPDIEEEEEEEETEAESESESESDSDEEDEVESVAQTESEIDSDEEEEDATVARTESKSDSDDDATRAPQRATPAQPRRGLAAAAAAILMDPIDEQHILSSPVRRRRNRRRVVIESESESSDDADPPRDPPAPQSDRARRYSQRKGTVEEPIELDCDEKEANSADAADSADSESGEKEGVESANEDVNAFAQRLSKMNDEELGDQEVKMFSLYSRVREEIQRRKEMAAVDTDHEDGRRENDVQEVPTPAKQPRKKRRRSSGVKRFFYEENR